MPTLYDDDVALWAEQQSRLLRDAGRQRRNGPIDWDHVAEEIESVGQSQKHEIRTRLLRIVEHLLKLQYSPAEEPRRRWIETVLQQRAEIESVLEDSPSLRQLLPEMLNWAAGRGATLAAKSLELQGERAASALVMVHRGCYTLEQVLKADPAVPD